jgi:hypothetical protein
MSPRSVLRIPVLARVATLVVLLSGPAAPAAAQPPPGLAATARDVAAPAPPIEADRPAAPPRRSADPLFPGRGHVSVSLATGVPFLAVGEVALGTSESFALGVVGGVADTLREYAVGGRARVAVFRAEAVSFVLSLPALYYPPVSVRHDEPWILTNPSLALHGRLPNDARLYGGIGALAASCTHSLAHHFGGDHVAAQDAPEGHTMVNGVWTTVHGGGSLPVSAIAALFVDASLMLDGLELARSYGRQIGPPGLAQLGVTAIF